MHDIPDDLALFERKIAPATLRPVWPQHRSSNASVAFRTPDWDGPGTGFEVIDAVAYIDTLTLYCWKRLPASVVRDLRRRYGCRLLTKEHYAPRLRRKFWTITIHQPDQETLKFLRTLELKSLVVVSAVHIAVDFLTPDSRQAQCAADFLTRGVLLKWRGKNHRSHLEPNTAYWNVDRKAKRNIAEYGDRQSKTGLGACCHFEMRFTSADACKRAAVGDLSSLINGVHTMALLNHQARIMVINAKRLDRAIEEFARQNLRRRSRPNITVGDIKMELQRIYARILQDKDHPLNTGTLAKARSQMLWDYRRDLRSCLDRVPWEDFTPSPRWLPWWYMSKSIDAMGFAPKQLMNRAMSKNSTIVDQ